MGKGESRDKIFSQVFSDIDSFGKEGSTVNIFGGFIVELLLILQTIEDVKADAEHPLHSNLSLVSFSEEMLEKWIMGILKDLLKEGTVEIGVTYDLQAHLMNIDSSLSPDNLVLKAKQAEIAQCLLENISYVTLNILKRNFETLKINQELFDLLIKTIVKILVTDEGDAKKIKLINAPQTYFEGSHLAYCTLMPNVQDFQKYDIILSKSKKGKNPKD
jgi:hypothetical protein